MKDTTPNIRIENMLEDHVIHPKAVPEVCATPNRDKIPATKRG